MKCLHPCLAAALVASALSAQSPPIFDTPDYDIVDGYPYVASKSVASDPLTNEIYDGAGGGIVRLVHTPDSTPALVAATGALPRFDTGGMTMDIALPPRFVYVAAGSRGLQVRKRPALGTVASFPVAGRAWTLAWVAANATHNLIFVGTHTPDGFDHQLHGELLVFDHDTSVPLSENVSSPNPRLLTATPIALGAPAWSVAASTEIPPPAGVTIDPGALGVCVLVGIQSGGCYTSAPPPLRRLDFAYTGGATPAVTVVSTLDWNGDFRQGQYFGRFIRDCVIDGAHDRAYAGAYWDGVYAFDLASGLAQVNAPGWPIKHLNAQSQVELSYSNALALDPSPGGGVPARLLVGRGWPLATETQYIGDCTAAPCNQSEAPAEALVSNPPTHFGVASYALDVSGAHSVALEAVRETVDAAHERKLTCEALAIRKLANGDYQIDIAADSLGFHVLRARNTSGSWSLAPDGEWSTDPPPAKLPLHAFDDAVIVDEPQGRQLYVATELGTIGFGIGGSSPTPLAIATPQLAKNGGVVLAAFANPTGRLIAGTSAGRPDSPGGLAFYDTQSPSAPVLVSGSQQLHRGGFGYGIAARTGFSAGERFLYAVSERKPDATLEWAVRAWDIGGAGSPLDPLSAANACTPTPCQQSEPCVSAGQEPRCLGAYLANSRAETIDARLEAVAAIDGGTNTHIVYALYAPEGRIRLGPAGVLVLKLVQVGQNTALQFVTTVDAWSDADSNFHPTRITVDSANQLLYAAWATGGIACYDISSPLAPVRLDALKLSARTGEGLRKATVQVVPGPVAISQSGVTRYLYVAELNDGVEIYALDPTGHLVPKHAPIPMRWQTIALAPDPGDPYSVYVCQGRAGIDKVTFDPSVFP